MEAVFFLPCFRAKQKSQVGKTVILTLRDAFTLINLYIIKKKKSASRIKVT
jgi:hypothetical protein